MVWCTPIVLSLPTLKVWNFNKLGILKAWLHYLRSHAYLQRTTLKATSLEIVNKWIRWETDLLWQPWLPPQFCNLLKWKDILLRMSVIPSQVICSFPKDRLGVLALVFIKDKTILKAYRCDGYLQLVSNLMLHICTLFWKMYDVYLDV